MSQIPSDQNPGDLYTRWHQQGCVFQSRRFTRSRHSNPVAARDAILLRVIGSPDPYGKQTDGMGGATSSTSKNRYPVEKRVKPGHDVDYLFGQVAIDKAFVDWSGNCGNLSAAVGPFRDCQRSDRC